MPMVPIFETRKPNAEILQKTAAILRKSLQQNHAPENPAKSESNLGPKADFGASGCQLWVPETIIFPHPNALLEFNASLQRLDLGWLVKNIFWPNAENARAPHEDSPVLQSGWHMDCDQRILRYLGSGTNQGKTIDLNAQNPQRQNWHFHLRSSGIRFSTPPTHHYWLSLLHDNSEKTDLVEFVLKDPTQHKEIQTWAQLLTRKLNIPLQET